MNKNTHIKTGGIILLTGLFCWGILYLLFPRKLFSVPYSTLLYSAEGELLGARIAEDGQWRFSPSDPVPSKFAVALTTYEDKRFFYHPGIDPIALFRALKSNIQARQIVSGGSTLTMQLARLARGNRDRNLYEKGIEAIWALFLETTHRKQEILELYASHAPFGGNVIGLETAAWRYFGRSAEQLSWAETTTLAVLPNSPALIHPGRNRKALKKKRDHLLLALLKRKCITREEYELGCMEPLPDAPIPLPNDAPHLLARMRLETGKNRLQTSVRRDLQRQVQRIVDSYARQYSSNHIYNLAALVADVETGEALAYAGNVSFAGDERRGNQVDIIISPRSTGSILKPFLYAGMLHDGLILPSMLVSDVPLNINGFTPQNYNKTFYGAVPAHQAIKRSLNVPLVRMLSQYNTGRFMTLLKTLGMTTLRFDEDHYGASLILGGAEGTLWDICGMYASLARVQRHYRNYNGRYDPGDIHSLRLTPARNKEPIVSLTDKRLTDRPILSAASLWFMTEAMSALNRPEEEADWQQFSSMKRIAWKTGTSYGGRDAWAVGYTPRFVVGIWAGNASGEGRPGLTGVGNAAPVLFDIFALLPSSEWFEQPYDEMVQAPICRNSGHKASFLCESIDTCYIPLSGNRTPICPYHQQIHISADGRFRVNSSCEKIENIVTRSWFVLPPAQEYYYRNYHIDYRSLPPFKPGCEGIQSRQIELIYPEHHAVLYLPKGFSGKQESFIFKAAHGRNDAVLYWHLDSVFIGKTRGQHQITCRPAPGKHLLTLIDSWGNQRKIAFEVKGNN
ncbi:MAG: penicillin-binding protein 1C [Massilibacteroides sp.]|nr:penicillin-binding protein 1C [Massilibacteroides sp.]MDD3061525.1 penicillin-binding protein 1C [Massilibacteroides sp.]MDD4114929.1 penicillin-binding protein 1C [Massilibacteroides sp.]MDD4659185.1 penicillin-binding protein 1C [Massilibacteroides sp.]